MILQFKNSFVSITVKASDEVELLGITISGNISKVNAALPSTSFMLSDELENTCQMLTKDFILF